MFEPHWKHASSCGTSQDGSSSLLSESIDKEPGDQNKTVINVKYYNSLKLVWEKDSKAKQEIWMAKDIK